MIVKRFKDFLLESASDDNGYHYKIEDCDKSWEYFLYKNKKLCGEFILDDVPTLDQYLYGVN